MWTENNNNYKVFRKFKLYQTETGVEQNNIGSEVITFPTLKYDVYSASFFSTYENITSDWLHSNHNFVYGADNSDIVLLLHFTCKIH